MRGVTRSGALEMSTISSMDLNPRDVGEMIDELVKLRDAGKLRGFMFAAKLKGRQDLVYDCGGALASNGSATGAAFSLAVHLATKAT